jgi:hypothetical protein
MRMGLSCEFVVTADYVLTCDQACGERGGECLSARNNAAGSCDFEVDDIVCGANDNHLDFACTCSLGCGVGPPCESGQLCTSGVCS